MFNKKVIRHIQTNWYDIMWLNDLIDYLISNSKSPKHDRLFVHLSYMKYYSSQKLQNKLIILWVTLHYKHPLSIGYIKRTNCLFYLRFKTLQSCDNKHNICAWNIILILSLAYLLSLSITLMWINFDYNFHFRKVK